MDMFADRTAVFAVQDDNFADIRLHGPSMGIIFVVHNVVSNVRPMVSAVGSPRGSISIDQCLSRFLLGTNWAI